MKKVNAYGLKMLSIVMNALGVVSGLESGALAVVVPTAVLLVTDLKDLTAMVQRDIKAAEDKEEE